ncbi:MAG TPA: baseplate J/gp47 family protein [Nevskia sp.]|nr:baseplate J/gp47 family protein [Nevskia sp.]
MPRSRPTLTQLRAQVAQDIASALQGSDPLLRFSNLQIMGAVQAAMENLDQGYLDWIAKQAVPYTSTDEFLEAWAGLKDVFRESATSATGTVTFAGTLDGVPIPIGTPISRGDGIEATVTVGASVSGGSVTVTAVVNADPSGRTGAFGNCEANTVWTLGTAIATIASSSTGSSAFTGGADLELDESLKTRMLEAYQTDPLIGKTGDYVTWAKQVNGVTRAWCWPNGMGGGTVVVYIMLDVTEAAHGGFPQGSDGVSLSDPRDTAATGDQLAVANHIYTVQTNTALVYVVAPIASVYNFTISGLAGSSGGTRAAIAQAITDTFLREGSPNRGTVNLGDIESAIAAVPLTTGFVITQINGGAPGNITPPQGHLPVLGTVSYV